jgi:hypothetical protein
MLGSAGGAALGGLGSAATGVGATGAGSALTSAGHALSTAAMPAAAGAGGAAGSSGIVPGPHLRPHLALHLVPPQSTQVIGAGGTGAGTGAGAGALLPSTPNPSLAELTNTPEANIGGTNISAPPYQSPTFAPASGAGGAPSFLSSLLPSTSQLQQGGLDVLAGGHGDYGGGGFMSQMGNALKARVFNSIAGPGQQQMDPQTAAILRALMSQRGFRL